MNDYTRFDVQSRSIVVSRRQADRIREAAEARLVRSSALDEADAPRHSVLQAVLRPINAVRMQAGLIRSPLGRRHPLNTGGPSRVIPRAS